MEYNIRVVDNGFVLRLEGEDQDEGYVVKELVFTQESEILAFLSEKLAKKVAKSA